MQALTTWPTASPRELILFLFTINFDYLQILEFPTGSNSHLMGCESYIFRVQVTDLYVRIGYVFCFAPKGPVLRYKITCRQAKVSQ